MPTYTNLTQVKRILRGSSRERVRFSDCITNVKALNDKARANTTLIFLANLVQIDPSFSGDLQLKFKFTTPTDYNVIKIDAPDHRELIIGVGETLTDYTTPDGLIVFPTGCWGGSAEVDDTLEVVFDSHISDKDADLYIEDAEVMVDMQLSEHGIVWPNTATNNRAYEAGEVPAPVEIATAYLAAYNIYTDVFADQMRDAAELNSSFSGRWKKRAESLLMSYIRTEGQTVPEVLSFPDFMDKIGIPDVGPGMGGLSSDEREINRDAQVEDIFGD